MRLLLYFFIASIPALSFCPSSTTPEQKTNNDFNLYVTTAQQLHLKKRYKKAIPRYAKALEISPDNAKILKSLGACYFHIGQMKNAILAYQKALLLEPSDNRTLYNIGCVLKTMGMMHEAAKIYEQVITINPDHHMAHIGLAKAYLATGNFERGWQEFEWRYRKIDHFKQKQQDTAKFSGKKVLVQSEWGLGDTMQFFRYVKLLRDAGATVIVATFNPLVQLFSHCHYVDYVYNIKEQQKPAHDIKIPMLSLPLIFGTTMETVPAEIPYLQADTDLVKYWKEKLGGKIKVGLCWQAKPGIFLEKQPRTKRSIELKRLAPIAEVEGVVFYSLQQQNGVEQLDDLPDGFVVKKFGPNFDKEHGRFMDTAAVIKNLDLVISVDTSVVHLAGGLGAKVWVMLPYSAEWRWMLDRQDTPWYPGMRLFRQPQPGDWSSVIERVQQELETFVNNKKKAC